MRFRQAYLHGFASSSQSYKGQALRRYYAEQGATFHTPDLNAPSFAELSYTNMLAAFDRFDAQLDEQEGVAAGRRRWRLVGSSMGGYISARWAQLHGARVDRLLLLCPAFDFVSRWPQFMGEQALASWRDSGRHGFPSATGEIVDVHYELYADAEANHPPRPRVDCPTLIVHGRNDETVPIESSRSYAAAHDEVELIEVDDDHSLVNSVELIQALAHDFLLQPRPRLLWEFRGAQAQGTAEHFLRHLDEFLPREGFAGCETGVEEVEAGALSCTWCVCAETQVAKIGPALRPHSIEHWTRQRSSPAV